MAWETNILYPDLNKIIYTTIYCVFVEMVQLNIFKKISCVFWSLYPLAVCLPAITIKNSIFL